MKLNLLILSWPLKFKDTYDQIIQSPAYHIPLQLGSGEYQRFVLLSILENLKTWNFGLNSNIYNIFYEY